VLAFALAMEERLKANDDRGDWKDEGVERLTLRMRQQLIRFEQTIDYQHQKNILNDAADVANFSMFIADVCGELK